MRSCGCGREPRVRTTWRRSASPAPTPGSKKSAMLSKRLRRAPDRATSTSTAITSDHLDRRVELWPQRVT